MEAVRHGGRARAAFAAAGSELRRLDAIAGIRGAIPTRRDAIFRRLLVVADQVAVTAGLALLGLLTGQGVAAPSLLLLPAVVLIAKVTGRYDHDEVVLRKSTVDEMPGLLTLAAACAITWSLIGAVSGMHSSRGGVVVLWVTTSISLLLARAAARAIARRSAPPERILIVGSALARARLAQTLAADPHARIEIAGFLPLEDESFAEGASPSPSPGGREPASGALKAQVQELEVQRVFVISSSADSEATHEVLTQANAIGVKVSVLPSVLEVVGSAVEFDEVGGLTVLSVRRPGLGRSSWAVKRFTDILGSLLGLVLSAPIGALIALTIKLDSPGPVCFRQRRVGRDGREFEMIKFRSMVDGADAQRDALKERNESVGLFKLSMDPRVTRVGRFLRRTSLDELPQLLNVLKGEMSLVGPRPLVPTEDCLIEGRHRDRLRLAPGMTGPWQVLGPTRPPLSEMVKIDFLYAANWSLWSDIKILVRTLAHIVGMRGV